MLQLAIIPFLLIIDQYLKYKSEKKWSQKPVELFNGNITLSRVYNEGAILGFLKNRKELLYISNVIALLFAVYLFADETIHNGSIITRFALSFILSGAFSNVLDRVRKGHVVDFIAFKSKKKVYYNFGDFYIFFGTIIIFIDLFR
jgi:signal peptidase II